MKFWTDPSFKALQDQWYKRLKRDGFNDAEKLIGGELVLRQAASHPYKGTIQLTREAKESYYMQLAQCVYGHWFEDEIERLVITWYSQGWKIREICEDLERRGEARARNTVRFIIRRYEILWGLKTYAPNQLNQYPKKPTP